MFKSLLEGIVNSCSGSVGAVLMGFDGIAIDQYLTEDASLDLNLIAIEYSNIVKEIRRAAEVLETGELQEVSIKSNCFYVIIYALTDEYFVALTINRDGNYGQGRYLLMRDAERLREALL